VVGMADGFARASGKLAAVSLHVAPGLGNAMGALYNAKFSGSPLIVTCGQQEQGHGLLEPLLYDPLVPIARPMVKWAIEATRVEDLPRILRRAAKVALTPPTGPVFVSLPGDVLDAEAELDLGHPTRVDTATRPSDEALDRLAARLLAAKRPVIVAGHELAARDAFAEATALAELLGAAVYQQSVPYAASFPSEHPLYLGAFTRSQKLVRNALEEYDLLVCLGADLLRMSVHSPLSPLPETLPVVHISERDWELGKNYPTEVAIRADVMQTLAALLPRLTKLRTPQYAGEAKARGAALAPRNWSAQRDKLRVEAMLAAEEGTLVILQIETEAGLHHVEEIAVTPGVDVLWVGQFDLSIAMGFPGAFDDPRMTTAEDRVLAACADAGITAGVLVGSVDVARTMLARGFRMVALGSDIDLYGSALREGLDALRTPG